MAEIINNNADTLSSNDNFNFYITDQSDIWSQFLNAINNNDINTVELLLPQIDPTNDDHFCLEIAATNGYTEIVELLLNDKRVKPYASAFIGACANGHLDIIKLLIKYKINPAIENNEGLIVAVQNGHEKTVEYLMNDHRVDSSAQHWEALKIANQKGYAKITQLLLKPLQF